jgi:DnaD/phage-associated family protein
VAELAWLKLYTEIRSDPKMRRLDDAEFRIWITVMCLAAESSKRGYLLLAPGLPLTLEDIALETNKPIEVVEAAFVKFQALKMVDLREEDNCYYLINFDKRQRKKPSDEPEAVNERVRRHRQKKANSSSVTPSCNANVTPMKRGCNATETEADTETDKDIETDSSICALVTVFEKEFGRPLSPIENKKIQDMGEEFGPELVGEALGRAVLSGKLNLRYIDAILIDWHKNNLKTLREIFEHDTKRKSRDPTRADPGLTALDLWAAEEG